MDLLQDIAKSAKNNTSDWKTDWKIRVFWHCLIKLCCFSHQDCQQKAKHIAGIQFYLQADTKWHSFLASSLCCVPSHLAYQPPWQATSAPGAALPQERGDLCSAHKPREPSSPRGHCTTYLWAKQEQHLLAKTLPSNESTCSSRVSLPSSAKQSRSQRGFAQQPFFQPEPGTPRGVNSPRALGSIAETSC